MALAGRFVWSIAALRYGMRQFYKQNMLADVRTFVTGSFFLIRYVPAVPFPCLRYQLR